MHYVIKHVGKNRTMINSNVPCALLTWEMFFLLAVNHTKRQFMLQASE